MMSEQERTPIEKNRIENWLLESLSTAPENWRVLATKTQIRELESKLQVNLPDTLWILFSIA